MLATPASPGSITTSGNKEDFVSMGMTSALKLRQVVEHVRTVLAIELMTSAHALDCRAPLKSSPVLEKFRAGLREVSPQRKSDEPFAHTIAAVSDWLKGWSERRTW